MAAYLIGNYDVTNPEALALVEFPSMDALQRWYDSSEYQAILHHRLDNTEGQMVVAEQFAMPA